MVNIFEKLQARIELFRLEQRYTRNRHRRSTFMSNAVYVDGEYVYQVPNSTGSSTNSSANASPVDERPRRSFEEPTSPTEARQPQTPAERKRANRFSAMPGFGSLSKSTGRNWQNSSVDVREVN